MKNTKFLNIKGAVLDNENLKKFMEKTAINYEVKKYSSANTYPIERVDENYLFIEKTYSLLNEHIKKNIILPLVPYVNINIIWDVNNLLDYKDSPTDKGKDTLLKLMENKIPVGTF